MGVGWEERDLVVSLVGTLTYSYYKWINISCLCNISNAMDMLNKQLIIIVFVPCT